MTMARDITRDVVRGITLLEMTFVNICSHPWTNHAGYIDQVSYADTIFPCFAFLAGMSRANVTRNVSIVGLGLALNATSALVNGDKIRPLGVLQRLGLASLIANSDSFRFLRRYFGLPLVICWYGVSLSLGIHDNPFAHPDHPKADPSFTAQTRIDTALFGDRLYTPAYDPEGLLGAITTAWSMILGTEFMLSRRSMKFKAALGLMSFSLGQLLDLFMPKYAPISKSLWTPSYVLITTGTSIIKYILIHLSVPYLPSSLKASLVSIGQRSIEVYLISSLAEVLLMKDGHRSIWFRTMAHLEPVVGRSFADITMSGLFTLAIGFIALLIVRKQIKLF